MERKLNTSLDLKQSPPSSTQKKDDQFFTFTFLNPQNVYLGGNNQKKRRQSPISLGQMMSPQSANKLALAQNQNKKQESSFLELYPGVIDLHFKQTRFQTQLQEKEFFSFLEKSISEAKQKERQKMHGTRQTLQQQQQQQVKQAFMKFQPVSSFEEHQAFDFIQDQQLYRRSGDKANTQARKLKYTYRMVKNESKLVRQTLEANGFRVAQQSTFCSLVWTGKPDQQQSGDQNTQLAVSKEGHYFDNLKSLCGKLNHFPLSSELTRKDRLTLNIQNMIQKHGKEAYGEVIPESYVLPLQLKEFREAFHEPTKQQNNYWISKPVDACQGKGIFISNKLQDFAEPVVENQQVTPQVISRYITDPLLIYRRKFDLRIYALVTDFEPFPKFYIYKEGLVRFATKEYDMKNLKNRKQHLTNYSINKVKLKEPEKSSPKNAFDLYTEQTYNEHHTEFDPFKSPKWKFSALMAYLETLKVDTHYLQVQIHMAMLKTLLASENKIHQFLKAKSQKAGFFELYGFDVLLDENLKPWVLEVNMMPSLACDSELDFSIKAPLISDALNIVGVKPANDTHLSSILHKEQMKSSGQTSSYFNQAPKNKRFQTIYEQDPQQPSMFQTARSKSFSPQKKPDSRSQTSLQAVKFFLNCKQHKRESLLDFCAEYQRSEQTNFQLVFPSPTLGSYLQKGKVESSENGYLIQGIQVHNLFTPYLQEGLFFGQILSMFHSDQNRSELDQQAIEEESPKLKPQEIEENAKESEEQEGDNQTIEPKATEKRIQEMRRKYQKSPAKSTRKEDPKQQTSTDQQNSFFQIKEVEEVAEQIQDEPIFEVRRPLQKIKTKQSSIKIQHFNTVEVQKPQEERLIQEGILPSQQQSTEKLEPSRVHQAGHSNLRTLIPAQLVNIAQNRHKEILQRQAFDYDTSIKGDDYMAEYLKRLIQILKLVPYIRIELSTKKNIIDFLEHKNWGKPLPIRQKDQNPILNKQVLVKCLEQRVQDLRAKSLRKYKKAFIKHHRNHLEEGFDETLLERLSFQEVERRILQEFSSIEQQKNQQFDNVENSKIEQEIIEKLDSNSALILLIPETQQNCPISTILSSLIDLANKPYSQQRKQLLKMDQKKRSLKQPTLQADQSCLQVSSNSPFQNEILKSVSKHASSQASFNHSTKSKDPEALTQSEITLKRREAKRDEILLNFVNHDQRKSKKLDMQQIQRDIVTKSSSQKRDRSHEDLQKIQSIQNLNSSSLDPYQQRQSIQQMRQTTFRVAQDLSKALQVRNIIMKSTEQQNANNTLSVTKESRNQDQIQQKSFQQTLTQLSPQSKKNQQSFRQKRKTNYSTVQRDASLQSTFLSPVNKSVIAQVSIKFYKHQQQIQQQSQTQKRQQQTNRSLIVTNFRGGGNNSKERPSGNSNGIQLPKIQGHAL